MFTYFPICLPISHLRLLILLVHLLIHIAIVAVQWREEPNHADCSETRVSGGWTPMVSQNGNGFESITF